MNSYFYQKFSYLPLKLKIIDLKFCDRRYEIREELKNIVPVNCRIIV